MEKRRFIYAGQIIFWGSYLFVSWLMLLPILRTPLVADDFLNPFYQFTFTNGGYWNSISYGWNTAVEGASLRLTGNIVGALANNLWIDISGRFQIEMSTIYAFLKYIVFVFCALSISYCLYSICSKSGREFSLKQSIIICSVSLFGTLQIHGIWSNDPVSSYPLSGFAVAGIGFFIIGQSINSSENISFRRSARISILCFLSVLYYEPLISVGLMTSVIFILGMPFTVLRTNFRSLVVRLLPSTITLITAVSMRIFSAPRSNNYSGTTVSITLTALSTFLNGLISSLPGSSWHLAIESLGGSVKLKFLTLVIVPIVIVLILREFSTPTFDEVRRVKFRPRLIAVALTTVSLFWIFAVGLQSITVKVQQESPEIGYVYSYYAVGASAISFFIGLVIALRPFALFRTKVLLLTAFSIFLVAQLSMSWRLSEHMSAIVVPNRELLSAFSNNHPMDERCRSLYTWSAGNWPDYYEIGMIDGLQKATLHYHNTKFCDNFNRL